MKAVRNIVAGLLVGFSFTFLLASGPYHWFDSTPWDTAPSAPNAATGAVYPHNKHGTYIYWTAQEERADSIEGNIGWIVTGLLVAGTLIQPKQNIRSESCGCFPLFSVRVGWDSDDPYRLFTICGLASAAIAIWFVFFKMPNLVTSLSERVPTQ